MQRISLNEVTDDMTLAKPIYFHEPELDEIVTALFDEIFQNKDILICLSQISTADDSTMVHSINTTIYSILIAIKSGLPTHELKELAEGALLHDLGKIILNESILLKSSALTQEEFNHIKLHPSLGYEALEKKHLLSDASRLVVLQHHERLDGSGYPDGLKGEEIHPYAQIVAISDVYDALTSERCYQMSLSNYRACRKMSKTAS